ncbi:Bacterial type II secretion system protein F domain protein [Novipirellula artificiosorum]|uniref:Bacterial type II secretion system protein F domain protein n=2 Tax=Novipirellula artificiosorum TaxID=2528016 RepID=A0A5C6D8X1_9BACT|nr:Bacterial type II secretion system protein F domain protein [Novipirellula artificiosorum]
MDEIASAMRSGTPVIDSMRRLQDKRLGRVALVAGSIAVALDRGESVPTAVGALDSPIAQQAAASVSASEKSNHSVLMERFSRQLRRRAEYARRLRLAWFYPLLLVVVGYFVAVLCLAPMIWANQSGEFHWPAWVVRLSEWLLANWYWPPVVFGVVVFLLFLLIRSRRGFPRSIRLGLFCSSLADQIANEVPEDVAIRAAASLAGDRMLGSLESPSLQSPQLQRILSEAEIPTQNLPGINQQQITVSVLHYLAAMYSERSRRHVYFWAQLLPRIAMAVIGGGLALSYVWWVIGPVYRQVAQW